MKKYSLLFFIAVLAGVFARAELTCRASVFSSEWRGTISSVSRLELTNGLINGEKADYTFSVPEEWKNRIIVDREKLAFSEDALEKLYFYFQPANIISQPVFFMSITVHEKSGGRGGTFEKLLETRKYIFEIHTDGTAEVSDPTDLEAYYRLHGMACDRELMRGLITLPSDDEKIPENAVVVNGAVLPGRVIKERDTLYLPLRGACEALGYTVGWLENDRAATVKRDATESEPEFYFLVFTDYRPGYPGFSTMNVDGSVYVSSMFFIQKLGTAIEIDEFNNVYIVE